MMAAASARTSSENVWSIACGCGRSTFASRSEEHTSELQSRSDLVCRLLLEKKKKVTAYTATSKPWVSARDRLRVKTHEGLGLADTHLTVLEIAVRTVEPAHSAGS